MPAQSPPNPSFFIDFVKQSKNPVYGNTPSLFFFILMNFVFTLSKGSEISDTLMPEVEVHTFGQPRVGNVNLAQFMSTKINTIFIVVHNRDIVPHVPFEWLRYAHPATEVFFS